MADRSTNVLVVGAGPVGRAVVVGCARRHLEAAVEFEVPYVAWGMKNPSKFLLKVAKQVQVKIHGVGTLSQLPGSAGS